MFQTRRSWRCRQLGQRRCMPLARAPPPATPAPPPPLTWLAVAAGRRALPSRCGPPVVAFTLTAQRTRRCRRRAHTPHSARHSHDPTPTLYKGAHLYSTFARRSKMRSRKCLKCVRSLQHTIPSALHQLQKPERRLHIYFPAGAAGRTRTDAIGAAAGGAARASALF